MKHENHLYLILFPIEALVGSHLEPDAFARHFNSGSSKYYAGKLIFIEVDPSFRHPYFKLEERLPLLVPHEDGRPKATKYFSTYRVLEHVDYDALGTLYVATPEGYVLPISPSVHEKKHQPGLIRIFWEVAPVSMVVLSDYNFVEYADFITNPENPISAPKMFYTQIDLEIGEFLKEFEENPLRQSPIPDVHPSVLRDGIFELQNNSNKHTKGLSLSSPLSKLSFKSLRHGFMFASQTGCKYYGFPALTDIEAKHYRFWRYM